MAAIDILLPVKNGLPYLAESLDSILGQTFRDWRLLILDHGSDDGSYELAGSYAERDKRVVVHQAPDAVGLSGLLNYGLDQADARIIVRQDGDDVSMPNRLESIMAQFKAEPELIMVGSEAVIIDAAGNQIGYRRSPGSYAAISAATLFYIPLLHPTIGMDLEKLNSLGARYGNDVLKALPSGESMTVLSLAEDYFLFSQLALLKPCRNITEPLIKYRYHDRSVSVSKRAAQNACALSISRFLANSLAAMHGVPSFDPGPFCSHAENVFDLGRTDYESDFAAMSHALRRALGDSPELARELAFRHVLAQRGTAAMGLRYMAFAARHGFLKDEYRVVRNWLGRFVTDKHVTRVENGARS